MELHPSVRRMDICRSRSHVGDRGFDRSRQQGIERDPALGHRPRCDRVLREILPPLARSAAHLTVRGHQAGAFPGPGPDIPRALAVLRLSANANLFAVAGAYLKYLR